MRIFSQFARFFLVLLMSAPAISLSAQSPPVSGARDDSKEPFVVEKLVNRLRFENDGTYTQDTQIQVRVQSASSVQDWGLIRLPYASQVGEATITDVVVTKPDGARVLTPSDTFQDIPEQITVAAPFYSDLKERNLAVKGLDVGDVLSYKLAFHCRNPLIPGQFWFDYDFFKSGVVLSTELYLSVPRGRNVTLQSPNYAPTETEEMVITLASWKTQNLVSSSAAGSQRR